MAASKRSAAQEEVFQSALKDLEKDLRPHQDQVTLYDRRYRAYRGVIESRSQAARWTNKQHPAIALQSVETMIASLTDPSPRWRLQACPILGSPEEIDRLRVGGKANEILLSHQLQVDHYAEKQRPFDLQNLILGVTASKQFWLHKEGPRRAWTTAYEPVENHLGETIAHVPRQVPGQVDTVYRDDPTTEVVDMRDLILPESAISLQTCPRLAHRQWFTFAELESFQAQGLYGVKAGGESIESLKDAEGAPGDPYSREQDLFGVRRTKDLVEVVDCWTDFGARVVTIANRSVLLASKENPFWFEHLDHRYPFVVASSTPDLFRIPGISEVELMAEIQEMLWTLMNQRLDSLQLLANAIFLIADDVEDPDAFEFGPGERWLVPRPVTETVKPWSPDPNIPRMTIEAEQLLRGDLQNVTGGMPFLSGTSSQSVDQQTATGVSIITSLAQKRLAAKKQTLLWAKGRIGEQWCALNQQFVRADRIVPVVGSDGAQEFQRIRPEMLQGNYAFQVEQVDESLQRQERRAEAQAKMQVALQIAPVAAQLAQAGAMPMINLKAYVDDFLEAFDIVDKERYYTSAKPPAPGPPQQSPPAGPPQQNGQGVTSPLASGPSAPSNDASQSAAVFAQRMLASQGGPNNAG